MLAVFGAVLCSHARNEPHSLYTYSFGGLEDLEVSDSVALLDHLGYRGIAVEARGEESLERLDEYYEKSDQVGEDFKIVAAYMAHQFSKYGFSDAEHRAAIDRLKGKDRALWIWFKDDIQDGSVTDERVEVFVEGIFEYALSKGVKIVLYPHYNTYYPTVSDALPLVEKINHPDFGVAVNLFHEIMSDQADVASLTRTIELAKHRIAAVNLSGSLTELDRTSVSTINASAILSLDESIYDLRPFMQLIKESGFEGPIGFINYRLPQPEDYLKRTMKRWEELCLEVGLYEENFKEKTL